MSFKKAKAKYKNDFDFLEMSFVQADKQVERVLSRNSIKK